MLQLGPPCFVDCYSTEHAYGDAKPRAKSQRHLTTSLANAVAWKHTSSLLRAADPVLYEAVEMKNDARDRRRLRPRSMQTRINGIFSCPVLQTELSPEDASDMHMHLLKMVEFRDAMEAFHCI